MRICKNNGAMDMRSYMCLIFSFLLFAAPPVFAEDSSDEIADIITSESPEVAEESDSMPITSESSSVAELEPQEKLPPYETERPNTSFQFHMSMQALGSAYTTQNTSGRLEYDVKAFGATYEFLPVFLQGIGLFGLGATFNFYNISDYIMPNGQADELGARSFSLWSFGGVARYQARWFRGQWLVPYAGYEYQHMAYNFSKGAGKGNTIVSGPVFGGLLYLNWLSHHDARILHQDYGIERSYLFAEVKNLTAADEPSLDIDQAIYFGLRLEF